MVNIANRAVLAYKLLLQGIVIGRDGGKAMGRRLFDDAGIAPGQVFEQAFPYVVGLSDVNPMTGPKQAVAALLASIQRFDAGPIKCARRLLWKWHSKPLSRVKFSRDFPLASVV